MARTRDIERAEGIKPYGSNKNTRRRAAGYFCSPGELHFGFNTLCYAPEARTRDVERAEGIKPYGSNKSCNCLYLPTQNLLNISCNMSAVDTSPVISPRAFNASLISGEIISSGISPALACSA
ncbi:MAG: hypothetical protein Ta2B_24320 [Termitinemataceae bacterium]|nr:MAG: hypothetical protein Ta2B_24320 [Termitinemataceae bacterium]